MQNTQELYAVFRAYIEEFGKDMVEISFPSSWAGETWNNACKANFKGGDEVTITAGGSGGYVYKWKATNE